MPKGTPKNPEKTKAKRAVSLKKYWSNPKNRMKHSIIMEEVQNRSEVKAKVGAAKLGDKNPMKRPEVRAVHRAIMKEVSKRPEVRANRSAAQKLIQKEIQNRPEVKAKVVCWGEKNGMFGVHRFGEDAANWRGGISKLPYPFGFDKELKEYVRKRDNNTCQLCGKMKEEDGRILCVHHINYDKKDLFELNLITLCRRCNGKVNSRREFWEDYFTFRMMLS